MIHAQARYSCYGTEIEWEPCTCEDGMVLDEREDVLDCPLCRGAGGFYEGRPTSREQYERELRSDEASYYASL